MKSRPIRYVLPDEHRALAREAVRLVRLYVRAMGLESWDISIAFAPLEDGGAAAGATPYFSAHLVFDLGTLAGRPEELRVFVRHELLHCVLFLLTNAASHLAETEERRALLRDLEETVTSVLDRMPVWDSLE